MRKTEKSNKLNQQLNWTEINHNDHNHDRYGLRIDFVSLEEDSNLTMRFLQREILFRTKKSSDKLLTQEKRYSTI